MRLVLDTNVIVAALRSRSGASNEIVRQALRNGHLLLGSTALALEYESVCLRPEHVDASGGSADDIRQFVDTLVSLMVHGPRYWNYRPVLRDPADELVLEAAINLQAEAIVTFNTRDFTGTAMFGIAVLTPAEFLGRYP